MDKGYSASIYEHMNDVPSFAKRLIKGADIAFKKIEKMLYTTPAFINAVKASVPEEVLAAVLTDEQKSQMAKGAVKLMTKKDGSLLAHLVNIKTGKFVADIPLKSIKLSPEILEAMSNYASQMQLAQIAQQLHDIQVAVEEVRQGQEMDRLALAYSCQQKLMQAMLIRKAELREMALLQIVSDAEDSRNLLMQSQTVNVALIKKEPESLIGKLVSGSKSEKIDSRMEEIRENLCAMNMVSFVEAMAYQEMGEFDAAQCSMIYYADYIQKTYLEVPGLVERLDSIDPAPLNYWSNTLPQIERAIKALPGNSMQLLVGDDENAAKDL